MIAPVKKSVNHARTDASMSETVLEKELFVLAVITQCRVMVSKMVPNLQIPYSFTFNDVILVHEYIHSH